MQSVHAKEIKAGDKVPDALSRLCPRPWTRVVKARPVDGGSRIYIETERYFTFVQPFSLVMIQERSDHAFL
jgi:hypothetical protein